MNLWKYNVEMMARGYSPLSSSAKIKFLASAVAENNAFKVQDYENIPVFFLWTEKYWVWRTNDEYSMSLSYLWWTHLKVIALIAFCLEWLSIQLTKL